MTSSSEQENKRLGLGRGRLELKKTVETGQVRQQFSHGRQKTVQVEIKRKRSVQAPAETQTPSTPKATRPEAPRQTKKSGGGRSSVGRSLTEQEQQARLNALKEALRSEEARRRAEVEEAVRRKREEEERLAKEQAEKNALARADTEKVESVDAEKRRKQDEEAARLALKMAVPDIADQNIQRAATQKSRAQERETVAEPAAGPRGKTASKPAKVEIGKKQPPARRSEPRRRAGKLTISQALDNDGETERIRSLASVRRAREREKQRMAAEQGDRGKRAREVTVPEAITVQELANRMAERGADVIKTLMKIGVMATINQMIDADIAELVITEFGHKIRRVSDADVEIGMRGEDDQDKELEPRAPVVTIMGHVDHGKTSLLDAIRQTAVVSREAGGITQHIGAYQVTTEGGEKISFIDTPGHAAFTEMRARGANVTDIVVLVVAADDGVMPQTIEAINHARAAEAPIIVAINKMDKQAAEPNRVRTDLLQQEIQVEAMGGDVLDVPVSAITKEGLDKLLEAIVLQAELLELKANPNRAADGVVIESKMEQGRGSVATVLVQRGTLRVGDVFVAGSEWGRVRALIDERGEKIQEATPSRPVEVLGLQGTPHAGDEFVVVENENRAREIAQYRQDVKRKAAAANTARGSLEQMFSKIQAGEQRELPLVIKTDVQGSLEAIISSLEKIGNDEVRAHVLHAGIGGINESDLTLAGASEALIVGFNVRANPQAREIAKRDNQEIRYYSVIYDLLDDVKAVLSGLLAPEIRETQIGIADIREVFSITKAGKVAGCMITEGVVRRGNGVRLLRDSVVVHEGKLKTLRRFKEEVKEVKNGYECGMAFENYQDIQVGDVVECYEKEEVAREL